jgi:eukaryotic-like serine/threonine-protein kinase
VAIKVPNPERVSGPGDVEAYLAEARALARLDDPNIVQVYDVGRTNDGLCFVVSRYIEGSDLAHRVRQGRPTFRESVELVAVVAGALHHAHVRGLVPVHQLRRGVVGRVARSTRRVWVPLR